jgi:hypothetical protein
MGFDFGIQIAVPFAKKCTPLAPREENASRGARRLHWPLGFWPGALLQFQIRAAVAELADAHGSGPCPRKRVGVQLPPAALGDVSRKFEQEETEVTERFQGIVLWRDRVKQAVRLLIDISSELELIISPFPLFPPVYFLSVCVTLQFTCLHQAVSGVRHHRRALVRGS